MQSTIHQAMHDAEVGRWLVGFGYLYVHNKNWYIAKRPLTEEYWLGPCTNSHLETLARRGWKAICRAMGTAEPSPYPRCPHPKDLAATATLLRRTGETVSAQTISQYLAQHYQVYIAPELMPANLF